MNRLLVALALILSPFTMVRADSQFIDCEHETEIFTKAKKIMESILTEDERRDWVVDTCTETKDFVRVLWKSITEDSGELPSHLEVFIVRVSDEEHNLELSDKVYYLIISKHIVELNKFLINLGNCDRNIYSFDCDIKENGSEAIADIEIFAICKILRSVRRCMLEGRELISIGFEMWEDIDTHFLRDLSDEQIKQEREGRRDDSTNQALEEKWEARFEQLRNRTWKPRRNDWLDRFLTFDPKQSLAAQ